MSAAEDSTVTLKNRARVDDIVRATRELLARVGVLLAASIAAGVIFQATTGVFFSAGNFLSIFLFMTSVAIIGFGETLVIVSGEFDLSVGSTYGLSSMSVALLWAHGWPIAAAIGAGIIIGALAGACNALFLTRLRVNSFITTLGTLNVYQGLTLLISHDVAFTPSPTLPGYGVYEFIGTSDPFGIPIQIFWLAGAFILLWLLLHRSVFGFRLAAIGGNPRAARAAHLPIERSKIYAFVISGVLAAVAGIIDFSLVSSVSPTAGSTLLFPVLAAVIIGGASLSGGRGTIVGTLVGAFLLEVLNNGLGLLGAGAYAQLLFSGGVILVAVAVDRWTNRSRAGVEL
ncbi:MAG TPA: ABC transporter permease [Gammaproteobacteria bacterium]|nr:ABC transporter permease [Gammaproteobacteria bacterium]